MKSFLLYHYRRTAILLLFFYGISNWYCSTRLSITGDELGYFAYGVNVLKGQPQKMLNEKGIPVFNSQMPVSVLNVLPRAAEQLLQPGLSKTQEQASGDILLGRLFSVLSAIVLGFYVFIWADQLYGKAAALLALVLYVLSPDIAAHSQLVGTDVYSFLICTATFYHAWRYNKTGGWGQLLLVALWLGIGQVTKQSLLLLYPQTAFLLALRLYRQGQLNVWKKVGRWLKEMILVTIVSIFIINAGFLFYGSGQSLGKYTFVSARFQQLQHLMSFIKDIPLPLPAPYVQGFDYVQFNTETGPGKDGVSAYGYSWFLGERMTGTRVWYYYPLCLLYKLPLAFWLLLLSALIAYIYRRKLFSFVRDEVFLLLPVLFIVGMFSTFNTMYHGVRNIAMILPLLFVFCGTVFYSFKRGTAFYTGLALLLLWQAVTVWRYWPHLLPYTNELVWNKKDAHHIFTDSNIYFQEGRKLVEDYLTRHPGVQYEPLAPVKGKVMVSLDAYYDFWGTGRMQWLRDLRLEPVAHFDSGYLIFDVP